MDKQDKRGLIAWGIILTSFFVFWMYINSDTSYPSSYSRSSTPSSTPSSSYASTSSYSDTSSNPNEYAPGVNVIATPVVMGDKLVIRTRVSNHNSYPINEKIRLFAEDARGVKYIVDIIYADLEPNQAGNSTSSIPLSKIGTAPHTVVVE